MSKSICGATELDKCLGKWVVVQAAVPLFGMPQLCARLVAVRPDGFELIAADHRAFINGEHVVAVMVPSNQDDFIASSLEQALKKVQG